MPPPVPRPGDQPVLPTTYAMFAVAAMVALHLLAPVAGLAEAPVTWLGAPFIGVGLVLNFWAETLLRRRGTPTRPFRAPRVLVREGPYQLSRHPMYLGMVLAALGIAMLLGTLSPFVVVGFLAWLIDRRIIAVEETMAEDAFGDAWRAYRSAVRRWF